MTTTTFRIASLLTAAAFVAFVPAMSSAATVETVTSQAPDAADYFGNDYEFSCTNAYNQCVQQCGIFGISRFSCSESSGSYSCECRLL